MSPDGLLEVARGFRAARALLTAVELDLFTILDEKPLGPAEIARATGASERGLEALLPALAAQGFLERRPDGAYASAADAARLLSRKSPDWRGAALLAESDLFARHARLTECVRTGRPAEVARDAQQLVARQLALHWEREAVADAVAAALPLEGKKRAIDLGGGTGTIAAALLRRHAGATATLFDLQLVLDVARRVLPKEWVKEGRLKLKAGDLIEDPPPLGFELAIVSDVLSRHGPAGARRVLQRAREALVAGGTLAVRERLDAGDRGLDLLVDTAEGRIHARDEIADWARQAGFTDPRWTRAEGDPRHEILLATRVAG